MSERAAQDTAFRRDMEAQGRLSRAGAAGMSDDALLGKLCDLGFELDGDGVERVCEGALSAQAAVQPLMDDWQTRNRDRAGDVGAVVVRLCDAADIGAIDEFDDTFPLTQSLFNWLGDLEGELLNAAVQDASYWTARIDVCEEALRRFTDQDQLTAENLRRAMAESHFNLGHVGEGESLFASWLSADPSWGWGWIGWSDCYNSVWQSGDWVDPARAEELLRRGLDQRGVRDRTDILSRLADPYRDTGRTDDARLVQRGAVPKPLKPAVTRDAAVSRNVPCPCGSGRKYKRCCGSPR
jgi:SEC-C motif